MKSKYEKKTPAFKSSSKSFVDGVKAYRTLSDWTVKSGKKD